MSQTSILLPSKIHIIKEEDNLGVYEIENLYPGYGHTLGNSLRRVILSSIPGAGITKVKISGVEHEFSTLDGMKEDIILFLLNLKKVRFKLVGVDTTTINLNVKGAEKVYAKSISKTGEAEILNPDQYLCELTSKSASLEVEITIETGLGFVPRDVHHKQKAEIGTIVLDALFSPIRRVSYDVENMRVGDKTNHNRLIMTIETDGTLTPRQSLEQSIEIMIIQLQAISGFKTEFEPIKIDSFKKDSTSTPIEEEHEEKDEEKLKEDMSEVLKTRIDTIDDISSRTLKALTNANIRTIGGIARKKTEDLLEIEGIGEKGIQEIKKVLNEYGINLK
jgi:DNA-directed RNA polymerase subunit alpha